MTSAEIDDIVEQRRRGEMRRRWIWVTVVVGLLVVMSFVLVPAMLDPVRALRLQVNGIEAQALVTHTDTGPVVCDAAGCLETPYTIVNLDGGSVPPQVLSTPIGSPMAGRAGYLLGTIDHRIASAADASKVGDTFPVWFVLKGGDPQDLTADPRPNPVVSGLTSWWWLVVPLLLIAFYPRIDAVLFRRRTTT
jgi:hypothetical protein